jgi:hypothetical protein
MGSRDLQDLQYWTIDLGAVLRDNGKAIRNIIESQTDLDPSLRDALQAIDVALEQIESKFAKP